MLLPRRVKYAYPKGWRKWTRCYSSPSTPEHVKITRPGDHEFSLDVYEPESTQQNAVVLFFPRGPVLPDEEADHRAIAALRSTLNCHIVQVNYKFDHSNQHPNAIFDAVRAFDWSVQNLLPSKSKTSKKVSQTGRFGVCGELIGGTIATVLALTECRSGQPGVVAAAVKDPITDWFDIENAHTAKKRSGRISQSYARSDCTPALTELIGLRHRLFKRPRDWVDPFASPIMFFRSAGAALPSAVNAETDGDLYYDEDLHGENAIAAAVDAIDKGVESTARYSRQFPARALGLQLPKFKVISEQSSFFVSQTEELVQQLSASVIRQRKARSGLRNRWKNRSFYDHDEQYSMDEVENEKQEQRDLLLVQEMIDHQRINGRSKTIDDVAQDTAQWLRQQLEQRF